MAKTYRKRPLVTVVTVVTAEQGILGGLRRSLGGSIYRWIPMFPIQSGIEVESGRRHSEVLGKEEIHALALRRSALKLVRLSYWNTEALEAD